MFAVVVEFTLHPDRATAFRDLIAENARRSLAAEPGCRQFDICLDPEAPNQVFLYEIYDDPAAFAAHLESAHFRDFDRAAADMVAEKSVRTFAEVIQ